MSTKKTAKSKAAPKRKGTVPAKRKRGPGSRRGIGALDPMD